jgi:hypothetical protein
MRSCGLRRSGVNWNQQGRIDLTHGIERFGHQLHCRLHLLLAPLAERDDRAQDRLTRSVERIEDGAIEQEQIVDGQAQLIRAL